MKSFPLLKIEAVDCLGRYSRLSEVSYCVDRPRSDPSGWFEITLEDGVTLCHDHKGFFLQVEDESLSYSEAMDKYVR